VIRSTTDSIFFCIFNDAERCFFVFLVWKKFCFEKAPAERRVLREGVTHSELTRQPLFPESFISGRSISRGFRPFVLLRDTPTSFLAFSEGTFAVPSVLVTLASSVFSPASHAFGIYFGFVEFPAKRESDEEHCGIAGGSLLGSSRLLVYSTGSSTDLLMGDLNTNEFAALPVESDCEGVDFLGERKRKSKAEPREAIPSCPGSNLTSSLFAGITECSVCTV